MRYAFDLARSRGPPPPHARAQDERAHVRRRPLAAHLRRGRGRVPRRGDRATTTSTPRASTSCRIPGRYDVVVTDNLFGDILTDLGGAVAGGIGRAASGNLNPARTGPSLFEPVHGSAPDIAGTGQRRPPGCDHLGCDDARVPGRGRGGRSGPEGRRRVRRRDRHAPTRSATRSPTGCREGPGMPIEKTEKIWMDGELVDWDDARIHVLTHTLHYGSGVFEGIRAYPTATGPAVFRLTDHIGGCTTPPSCSSMDIPYSASRSSWRRPRRRSGSTASSPATSGRSCTSATARWGSTRCRAPVNVSIAVWPWGTYLGDEGVEARRAHEGVVVAAHGPERQPGRGQGHRHLHQLEPGEGRGAEGRLRRGDPAQHPGLRRRVHRREHVRREERRAHHAAAVGGRARGHHPRLGDDDRPRPRLRGAGREPAAHRPVHRRRGVPHRHRRRDRADPLGRRPRDRRARRDHPQDPGDLLRHRPRRGRPVQGMARACP